MRVICSCEPADDLVTILKMEKEEVTKGNWSERAEWREKGKKRKEALREERGSVQNVVKEVREKKNIISKK